MRKITVLLILATTISSLSQSKIDGKSSLKVLYQLDYKKFVDSDHIRSDYTVLISKNQGSLFTFEKMMDLDSIQQIRILDASDAVLYRPAYFFLIQRKNDSIYHNEMIGNDLLQFKESILFDWKLVDQEKKINGFTCKKATLNYGDRNWIAWYTTDIPRNVGPYKFYGLPGLIINIKDTESTFEFMAKRIEIGNFNIKSKVDDFFVADEDEKFEEIEKKEFYLFKNKFYSMNLKERFNYMNREDGGIIDIEVTDVNGEKTNTIRKAKKRNFIEKYEE